MRTAKDSQKERVPLRPILSMIGSAQHQLAKYLSFVLQPVLEQYSGNCVKDSFTFLNNFRQLAINPTDTFLFTNVPLEETIQICADALYDSNPFPRISPKTRSFNSCTALPNLFSLAWMTQVDGVAIGSPLGPAFANIFVGFYKSK